MCFTSSSFSVRCAVFCRADYCCPATPRAAKGPRGAPGDTWGAPLAGRIKELQLPPLTSTPRRRLTALLFRNPHAAGPDRSQERPRSLDHDDKSPRGSRLPRARKHKGEEPHEPREEKNTMAVDIRSTANFGAYLKDRCKVIGARIKSDGTQVRWLGRVGREAGRSLATSEGGGVSSFLLHSGLRAPLCTRRKRDAGSWTRAHSTRVVRGQPLAQRSAADAPQTKSERWEACVPARAPPTVGRSAAASSLGVAARPFLGPLSRWLTHPPP